ncbi:MAG TPA: pantoate--beta-alanine ligase [Pseudomonadales bacterium]|nr:pantoate--beta-alanine ligase [Pseudomonadales bacterium]
MKTINNITGLRAELKNARRQGKSIAFVPTMGNLHAGHIKLVNRAKAEADVVVVSIFVNPLQFGANEDLDNYPRTLADDQEKLIDAGAHLLFTPTVDEIYPEGMEPHAKLSVPMITNTLCGAARPGHFDGVTTVVNKLFNIVLPDVAIFGQKDFQQLAVIRKMVKDFCIPIHIIGEETARAEDKLALSSRNGYLSNKERAVAPAIYRALAAIQTAITHGDRDFHALTEEAKRFLEDAGFVIDYVDVRDATTLMQPTDDSVELVILAAATLGTTRLIDNLTVTL